MTSTCWFAIPASRSTTRDGVGPIFVDPPAVEPTCGDLLDEAYEYGFFTLAAGDLAVENG
jgi:hypothetical protein